jgi:hypothetical protein
MHDTEHTLTPALSHPMGDGDFLLPPWNIPEPVGSWSARTGIRKLPRPSDGRGIWSFH